MSYGGIRISEFQIVMVQFSFNEKPCITHFINGMIEYKQLLLVIQLLNGEFLGYTKITLQRFSRRIMMLRGIVLVNILSYLFY